LEPPVAAKAPVVGEISNESLFREIVESSSGRRISFEADDNTPAKEMVLPGTISQLMTI
jgi:hypothetical protein